MRRALLLLVCACAMSAWSPGEAPGQTRRRHVAPARRHAGHPAPPVDQRTLAVQVMLDRAGFSPGEIDGRKGLSTERALEAYTRAGGNPDAHASDAVTTYTITEQDAEGPFTPRIPTDLMQQATLDALDYRDIFEELGERFHASPTLLRRLNPGVPFKAGDAITVPSVLGGPGPVGPPPGRQSDQGHPSDTTVTVTKSTSDLVVTDAAGHTLFYAPVTTGSEHDPLPIGQWKVTGVQHNPKFHYNPKLFWDAKPGDAKATIAPGPNNPVGLVWIDLSKPNYGIHGTPEPSLVGKTTSHGCVRLTNWDAVTVASLVHPGTRVVFRE